MEGKFEKLYQNQGDPSQSQLIFQEKDRSKGMVLFLVSFFCFFLVLLSYNWLEQWYSLLLIASSLSILLSLWLIIRANIIKFYNDYFEIIGLGNRTPRIIQYSDIEKWFMVLRGNNLKKHDVVIFLKQPKRRIEVSSKIADLLKNKVGDPSFPTPMPEHVIDKKDSILGVPIPLFPIPVSLAFCAVGWFYLGYTTPFFYATIIFFSSATIVFWSFNTLLSYLSLLFCALIFIRVFDFPTAFSFLLAMVIPHVVAMNGYFDYGYPQKLPRTYLGWYGFAGLFMAADVILNINIMNEIAIINFLVLLCFIGGIALGFFSKGLHVKTKYGVYAMFILVIAYLLAMRVLVFAVWAPTGLFTGIFIFALLAHLVGVYTAVLLFFPLQKIIYHRQSQDV